jgi:hypothetical protein
MLLRSLLLSLALYRRNRGIQNIDFQSPDYVLVTRRISIISREASIVPLRAHELVKMPKRGYCKACKGLRLRDRPRKMITLQEIAANKGRETVDRQSSFGCKQCDRHLCKFNSCFRSFHAEKEEFM